MNELRLIEDKAGENYKREKIENGLVIIEAYYGEAEAIEEIASDDKPAWLAFQKDSSDAARKVIDVTVPLRFFVDNGHLKIMANNRESIYGFCRSSRNVIHKTLIIYQPKGQPGLTRKRIFNDSE
jgi:hypothetical protein